MPEITHPNTKHTLTINLRLVKEFTQLGDANVVGVFNREVELWQIQTFILWLKSYYFSMTYELSNLTFCIFPV